MPRQPTVFDSFEFPEYEFKEYPKWVHPQNSKKPILVQNKREEQELLQEGDAEPEKDERTLLMEKAEQMGLTVNKSWGVARLRTLIEEAQKAA